MKKKLLLILIILVLLASIGIIYLNNVILPTKIRALIIKGLSEQTQKEVSLESLQFNIFKGLVLRNLKIYDDKKTIFSLKEGSCVFFIPSIKLKENILYIGMEAKFKDIAISQEAPLVKINSEAKVALQYSLKDKQLINGSLDIRNTVVKLEKINARIEDICGRLEFIPNQLKWSDLNFKYLDIPYKTEGMLTNFQAPNVQLKLSSKDLSLGAVFAVDNKLIKLSKLTGRYLNSEFSLAGSIDTANPPNLAANISAQLNIDLQDIKEPFKKFRNQWEKIKPQGLIHTQFNVNGNINDFKSCNVEGKLSSSSISAYGLKAKELLLNYNQAGGIIDIPLIHLSMYDGAIEARANMNLNSEDLPYWISVDVEGVKIEKLKLDTAAKEKDIAGIIQAQAKLNGFSNDWSRLSGVGRINIAEGKLWQLNLFKGLGSLLFAKDFANIIFSEGSCGFFIKDKYIFTEDLKLKSYITDLSGSVKIGFDSSIDASLNVQILDDMVPLSGTFKDIATAILGQAGRFGVIKITGTLKEPKYKFQPAVIDIIRGLKESLFGQ